MILTKRIIFGLSILMTMSACSESSSSTLISKSGENPSHTQFISTDKQKQKGETSMNQNNEKINELSSIMEEYSQYVSDHFVTHKRTLKMRAY